MKELVVISGKGGTGKTSITASIAVLAGKAVIADCDVDAADLHLILEPQVQQHEQFFSGKLARIDSARCTSCGLCAEYCRFTAIVSEAGGYRVDPNNCEGCGVCVRFCPVQAIAFEERHCGEWMISDTRCGGMVHAKLGVAAENSGKLVSMVRRNAQQIAEQTGASLIIVDGPPGIGCPVIASVTGASRVLIVTEPTVSGAHDMQRVLKLTRHFDIPALVCINKWDLNPQLTEEIEATAESAGATVVGRVRYDALVSQAQIEHKAVVETSAESAEDIRNIWKRIENEL